MTLRTPVALDAIRAMKQVDGAVVGAGTVTNQEDLAAVIEAGAEFVVSPGLTEPLVKAAARERVPFLPGIANAGDIMRGLDLGLDHFKFFPAEASGGRSKPLPRRSIKPLLPHRGVGPDNAKDGSPSNPCCAWAAAGSPRAAPDTTRSSDGARGSGAGGMSLN